MTPPMSPDPVGEMREAVEPFLKALSKQQERADSEGFAMWGLTMAHLRRLAAAVEGLSARSGVGGEDFRPELPSGDAGPSPRSHDAQHVDGKE